MAKHGGSSFPFGALLSISLSILGANAVVPFVIGYVSFASIPPEGIKSLLAKITLMD
jgi:hypothetical protein